MNDRMELPHGWREAESELAEESDKARIVADYIAGMTDQFAFKTRDSFKGNVADR